MNAIMQGQPPGRLKPGRHRGAKIPAGPQALRARAAKHAHWTLRAAPSKILHDRLNRADRPGDA